MTDYNSDPITVKGYMSRDVPRDTSFILQVSIQVYSSFRLKKNRSVVGFFWCKLVVVSGHFGCCSGGGFNLLI